MRLHKSILIGIVFAVAIAFVFPAGSFACWTLPQYREDCCDWGYADMGAYCCETWEDCFHSRKENCQRNPYRVLNPCTPETCFLGYALEDEGKIDALRRFRDGVLSQTAVGQEYIDLYYEWSPAIIKAMEEDEEFKEEVKALIDTILPMIERAME